MFEKLHLPVSAPRWQQLVLMLLLAVAGLLPGRALAQSPGPDGGTLSPANTAVCPGFNSGTLTLTGFTGTVLRYQANSGSGFVDISGSGGRNTFTFTNLFLTTSYRAVVQNGANPAVTSTVATVTVDAPPTATINSSGPTRFCQRGTIFLIAGPSGPFTYQFQLNGRDITGATGQSYTALVTASGSYSVRITNATGCSSTSASINIQVQPQGVVNLTANGPTTVCQGTSVPLTANITGGGTNGYTYQYYLNNVLISGAISATYLATASGAYTVVVNNPATCSSTSNAVNVTVNPRPVVSISYPQASYCQSGPANPVPTVSPAGGQFTAPAGLRLNAANGTITLSLSQPGTYTVTYTSGGQCPTAATTTVAITAAPRAAFSYPAGAYCAGTPGTITPALAAGSSAGAFSASPAGLSLNAATGDVDLAQSQAGTYTVTNNIDASNGCAPTTATASLTVGTLPTPVLGASGPTTFCQGGSVTLTASGGTGGATYQFLNNGQPIAGAIGTAFTATAGGSYTVTVTNPGGCAATSTPLAVTVNPATTATFSYDASPYCQNGTNPTPAVTGTAGGAFTAPGGLSVAPATGVINLAASAPGTYTVTYSVGGPCPSTGTTSVTITAPAVATFSYDAATYCASGANPVLTLGSGATAGTFASASGLSLNAATGAVNVSQSQPGTYAVTNTVAASGGCPAASTTASFTIRAAPTAGFSYAAGTYCAGTAGTLAPALTTDATAGTFAASPAGLSLNPATGVVDVRQSQPGTYTVTNTVAAANGCAATSATTSLVILTQPVAALAAGGPTTFCQGGSVTLTASGGNAGATYQFLNNGQPITGTTGSTYAATTSGSYTVSVTNTGGCTSTSAPIAVTVNPTTTATFSYSASPYCLNGTNPAPSITGTAGGTFAAPTGLSVDAATGVINLGASTAGTYTVSYSVGGPCPSTGTTSVTLTAPAAAGFSYAAATFCVGGASPSPTLTMGATTGTFASTNGLIINPATGAIDLTQSQSGTYTVTNTVGASGGCPAASATTQVSISAVPVAMLAASGPTTFCQGGSVTLTATGGAAGATYQFFSNGQPVGGATGTTLVASVSGSYSVVITNAGPCPATSAATSVVVTAPATAGFSYAATTFCVGSAPASPTLTAGATAGTFSVSPAGLNLNPTTGAVDVSQSQPGTYTVTNTVAASGGCPAVSATAQLSISAVPVATLAANGPTTFCQGGSVTLTANGGGAGSTYQFLSNGQPISGATGATFVASASGSYGVVITNAGVCAGTSAATAVTVNAIATPTLSYPASSFCQGAGTATATVSVSGGSFAASPAGLSLNASTGALNLALSQPGTYTVTYTGGSPCPGAATATVTVTAVPSAAFAYASGSTFCPTATNPTPGITGATGGTFSAPAGLVIDPATGTINLQTSTAGTYAVTYAVAGSCPASSTLNVTITTAPVATFGYAAAGGYCAGAAGTVAPTFTGGGSAGTFSSTGAGLVLNANTGVVSLGQSQQGTYTVTNTIAASGACAVVTATASLTVNAAPTATLAPGGPTTFCQGGSVVLLASAGPGFMYQFLNNGQPIGNATGAAYTANSTGSYSVAITNASGCTSTSPATAVTVNPATTATFAYPAASFCVSNPLATTPTVTGTAGGTFAAPAGLSLNAGTGAITPGTSTPGTYTVTYSVGGACPSTGTTSVTITAPARAAFGYASAAYCATGTAAAALTAGSTAGTFSSTTGLSVNPATGALNLAASTSGTYTVTNTVAASGGCASTTATATVTVNPLPATPTLSATYNGATTTLTSSAATDNQFLFNGTPIAGATGQTYVVNGTPAQLGSYTVVTTSAAGCTSAPSAPLVVTAARNTLASATLQVAPNPTRDGRLTVTLTGAHPLARLTVFNALGQVVLTATLPAGAPARELDLGALATGVYVLRATTTEGTVTRRIVRE